MFGRHPSPTPSRLALFAYLGLQSPVQPDASREHYASKLKMRPNFDCKATAREAEKVPTRNKVSYDLKGSEATLDIGNHVLVRNVGLRGKHKLADK